MYAYIQGALTFKHPTKVVLDNNGIGYDVNISLQTYSHIQSMEDCKLFIYMHVKEDEQTLYGFAEESEKELFIQLISISGIGPNTARMILSALSASELQQAILQENEELIKSIKGIGPKSAKRMILELKDKIGKDSDHISISKPTYNTNREEALSALVMLGFSKPASDKALDKVLTGPEDPVEELIKNALKLM